MTELKVCVFCGSRAGKMEMHSAGKPFVNQEVCIGCGSCKKNCADGCSNTQKPTELSAAIFSVPEAAGLWTVPMSATI